MLKLLVVLLIIFTFVEAGQKSKYYTKKHKGCKCWWDLEGGLIDPETDEPYSCACCRKGGTYIHTKNVNKQTKNYSKQTVVNRHLL